MQVRETFYYRLCKIYREETCDPVLLAAICNFTLDVFKCEEIRYSQPSMQLYYNEINNLSNPIQYLGFEKYGFLLLSLRQHSEVKGSKNEQLINQH